MFIMRTLDMLWRHRRLMAEKLVKSLISKRDFPKKTYARVVDASTNCRSKHADAEVDTLLLIIFNFFCIGTAHFNQQCD